ncbi:MAG: flagellar protein FlaG [Spirochaetaceae bacterium]|nr:flagellar protein FlaG [Spirochaetaceae bacterium]
MELGIQGRINQLPVNQQSTVHLIQPGQDDIIKVAQAEKIQQQQQQQQQQQSALLKKEIDNYIRKVLKDASLLNRDLRYSINRETDEVIVKVVDKSTDKVIKEIPPESLQRLQARLKEQLGLLVDEKI